MVKEDSRMRSEQVRDALVARAVADAQQGELGALDFLYTRYADDVFGYVNSIVRDHHEAEDITHNVFAKLMGAIGKYEQRQVPFSAWILRVARNAALDHLRARRAVPCEEVRGSDECLEDGIVHRAQCLREALRRLPIDQREVLVLRHIAGLSPVEIANHLGKTESSVHGLHHRGRGALRDALVDLDTAPVTA